MRGIWKKLKQLIRKVVKLVKELITINDEFKDIKDEIQKQEEEREYREEIIENFKKQKGHGVPHFSQQKVNKFNEKKSTERSEKLGEEEMRRDDLLASLFSGFPQATRAIADTVWEVIGNLPQTVSEAFRENLYKILKEKGETKIIKPSINPEKFYGKYSGEGKNYIDLFDEKERNFLSLSRYVDKIDVSKRAEAMIWYYDRENDLEWGNIYLAGLNNCDPRRLIDLRRAYMDIFTEIWDDEKEKLYQKSIFDLAYASDQFFDEVFFRMKMERLYGIEWFKGAYGRELIES